VPETTKPDVTMNPTSPTAASNAVTAMTSNRSATMNSYQSSTPRTAFAAASVALAALTMALLVGVPARFGAPGQDATVLEARRSAPIEVAVSPIVIHVIGIRESAVASAEEDGAAPGESTIALVGTVDTSPRNKHRS
jgi:hypothetical protein